MSLLRRKPRRVNILDSQGPVESWDSSEGRQWKIQFIFMEPLPRLRLKHFDTLSELYRQTWEDLLRFGWRDVTIYTDRQRTEVEMSRLAELVCACFGYEFGIRRDLNMYGL